MGHTVEKEKSLEWGNQMDGTSGSAQGRADKELSLICVDVALPYLFLD